jgi:hypothetical protein
MGCPADSAMILQTVGGVGVNSAWPTEPYARKLIVTRIPFPRALSTLKSVSTFSRKD